MKALEPDPWATAASRYSADAMVSGRVTRLAEFGAFVEVEPGLEGCCTSRRWRRTACAAPATT